jgi:hypothetical protein
MFPSASVVTEVISPVSGKVGMGGANEERVQK